MDDQALQRACTCMGRDILSIRASRVLDVRVFYHARDIRRTVDRFPG
jgi:hypothetical protein